MRTALRVFVKSAAGLVLICGASLSGQAEPAPRLYTWSGLDWTGMDANGALIWGMDRNPINNLAQVDADENGTKDFHETATTNVDPSDGLASNTDGLLFRWDYIGSPARAAGLDAGNKSYTLELDLDVKATGAEGGNGVFGVLLGFTDSDDRGRLALSIHRTGLSFVGGIVASNVLSTAALAQSNIGKHTWRIAYEASETNFWFYRDGVLLNKGGTGVSGTNNLGPAAVTAFIGDYSASIGGDWELDYMVLDPTGAFSLPGLQVSNLDGAANVTTNAATLQGLLDWTNAAPTTVSVLWGTSDGGTTLSAWDNTNAFGGVEVGVPLSTNVMLMAESLYYYRFYASNALSEAWAANTPSFTTAEIQIEATDPLASEVGPDTGEFTVSRGVATNGEVIVNVVLSSASTATEGVDFDTLPTTITIPDGASNATFIVTPIADSFILEDTDTVVVAVSPGDYVIGTASNATVAIAPAPEDIAWPFDLTLVEGLALWLDATDIDGNGAPDSLLEGAPVSTWVDKSGLGNHATQATTDLQPAFTSSALLGTPVIRFDGVNDRLSAGTTSSFKSLHDGTGGSLFVVWYMRESNGNDLQWVVDTGGGASVLVGMSYGADNRAADTDSFWYYIGNGNIGTGMGSPNLDDTHAVQDALLGVSTLQTGSSEPDFRYVLNGVEAYTFDGLVPSSADHARVLSVGATSAGAFPLKGDVAEVLVFDRALSSNAVDVIGAYLEAKYALDTAYEPDFLVIDNYGGATDVTASNAVFSGRVTATDGLTNTVKVFWGETDGGTNMTDWAATNTLGHRDVGPVSTNLNLDTGKQYYYRYFISSAGSQTWAPQTSTLISGPITFLSTTPEAHEIGAQPGTLTLARPATATAGVFTVYLTLEPASTATPMVDYVPLPALVTLASGQVSSNLTVIPVDDWIVDEDVETVSLSLVAGAYASGSASTGTVSIISRITREDRDSVHFAYKYALNTEHMQNQDLDMDGNHDWFFGTAVTPVPWPDAPSGDILNPIDLFHSTEAATSIWNTVAFDGDYTLEASIRTISQSNSVAAHYFGAMTIWSAVSGPETDTGLLYIGTNDVFYGVDGAVHLDNQDNTDRFHTYRVVRRRPANSDAMFWVWRDNALLNPGGTPMANTFIDVRDMLLMGDTSFGQNGEWELNYMRMSPGAYAPQAPQGILLILR